MICKASPFIPIQVTKRGLSTFFRRSQKNWKVLSGKWEMENTDKGIIFKEPLSERGESIIVFDSSDWDTCSIYIRFKMLTESIKPPEGGVIVYFRFKNAKNYYSFHLCLPKQRVEFVKRYSGTWTIGEGKQYGFEIQRDYEVNIKTDSGLHECWIDDENILTVEDVDITEGCVGIGSKYCGAEFNNILVNFPDYHEDQI